MENLKIFENKEFGQVRVIVLNNKEYFYGVDIATALGYERPSKAVSDHCNGILMQDTIKNSGGYPEKLIPEGDVYRLVSRSQLPSAAKFESWVFDEVLPTIRKTGGYVSDDDMFIRTYLPFADDSTKALFKSTLEVVKSQNKAIEQMKPKAIFADAVEASHTSILIGDLAKLIKQNGHDIGQKRLFEWLRKNGFLIKGGESKNMPTQKAMEMGLFQVKETSISNSDGSIRITKTTKVTGKGQIYFINKFCGKEEVL